VSTPAGAYQGKKRELQVLALTPFYPTERDDSQGCFVAEPLHPLAQFGISSAVFAMQPIYRARLRPPKSNVPSEWIRYLSLPGGWGLPTAGAFVFSRIVGRVRELVRQHRIDLIHAHAALPAGHAAMLLGAELGLPYVVSVHGLDVFSTEQVGGRVGGWCQRLSRRVYQGSRRVICVSELVRERVLAGMGTACRTSVVYNGVDTDLFSPSSDAEATKGPVVLCVGNLLPIKGHEVLIRAIASIAAEFPSLMLEIVGHGPEQARLQALTGELGINERVRFRGRQPRREVADAMRRCTIFALPSSYEGLGCVYLEAMSAGKPVVGCRGQGIAEIIRQGANGLLVGPGNEKELALALAMLLRDERRKQAMGLAARDTIIDRLTLTQQAENLARIYRECVG
jgi:glycosyltransferase involved in cell wall biosynthesis